MQQVTFEDLGIIAYQEAWDYQTRIHQDLIARKRQASEEGVERTEVPHRLLFCEHPPVYTLGKSGSLDHLLLSEAELTAEGFSFFKINRGGDITYHGPGQLVGYPIFDLDYFFHDVHQYVRYLEEVIIRTLTDYNLEGYREKGYTGVWLAPKGDLPKRKICAIGVHMSRWVTLHGFAFNINTNLDHFGHIIPCGIADADKGVTSLAVELEQEIDFEEVKGRVKKHFAELFGFAYK